MRFCGSVFYVLLLRRVVIMRGTFGFIRLFNDVTRGRGFVDVNACNIENAVRIEIKNS